LDHEVPGSLLPKTPGCLNRSLFLVRELRHLLRINGCRREQHVEVDSKNVIRLKQADLSGDR